MRHADKEEPAERGSGEKERGKEEGALAFDCFVRSSCLIPVVACGIPSLMAYHPIRLAPASRPVVSCLASRCLFAYSVSASGASRRRLVCSSRVGRLACCLTCSSPSRFITSYLVPVAYRHRFCSCPPRHPLVSALVRLIPMPYSRLFVSRMKTPSASPGSITSEKNRRVIELTKTARAVMGKAITPCEQKRPDETRPKERDAPRQDKTATTSETPITRRRWGRKARRRER